jgi:hypothetical protein
MLKDFEPRSKGGKSCASKTSRRTPKGLWQAGDEVAEADFAGDEDLGEDALSAVFHEIAETGSDAIHFFAGVARVSDEEDGGADLDSLARERDEIDAFGFDVGADDAGRKVVEAQGGGVLGDLFAFDESHLALGGRAGGRTPAKIALVLDDAFFSFEVEFFDREHFSAGLVGMNVERNDASRG